MSGRNWPALARNWPALAACGWALFMLFGSWYPFQFHPGSFEEAWSKWNSHGIRHDFSITDFVVNFWFGLPLGFLVFLALTLGPQALSERASHLDAAGMIAGRRWIDRNRHSTAGHVALATLTLFLVAALGSIVELGQHWFGNRVSSRGDTVAQLIGGLFGIGAAAIGGSWFASQFAMLMKWAQRRPRNMAVLDLYSAGYLFWSLMPFIPALTPTELKAKWHFEMIQLSPLATWSKEPLQTLVVSLICLVAAVPIGMWISQQLRIGQAKRSLWIAVASSVLVVSMLEMLQVMIQSRTGSTNEAIFSSIGAVTGVVLARKPFNQ